jgi:Flp pilus assembly protein TadG
MTISRERSEKESGQSLVLIALLMVSILAFLGLLIDGGRAYEARRVAQNAADAAAFAGARALTARTANDSANDQTIRTAVNTFALANGAASASNVLAYYVFSDGSQGSAVGGGSVPSTATGVRAFVTLGFQPFLISILSGSGPASVSARATAQGGPPTEMDNLMPMTLMPLSTGDFQYGIDYQLQGSVTGSGSFQWLSFDCNPNSQDLADYLNQAKSSGLVDVGDSICTGTGMKPANDVTTALDAWLSKPANERVWTIPVYDYCNPCSGSGLKYHIVAFALFEFDGYNFNGNNKYVSGKFLKMGRLQHVYQPGQCNTTGLNGCSISLSQ